MDGIKQWVICVIFSSLIGAVVSVLSPKGSNSRAVKTVISVFMISAFLSPILDADSIEADFDFPDYSSYQSSLQSEITDTMVVKAEDESKMKIQELLLSLNVEYDYIDVDAAVNAENSIYIKRITLKLDKKFMYRKKQISSNFKAMFSAEVEFIWVND